MNEPRRRVWLWAGSLAVVGIGIGAWCIANGDTVAPAASVPAVGREDVVESGVGVATGAVGAQLAAERDPVRTGIRGRLYDRDGKPLAGWVIGLQRTQFERRLGPLQRETPLDAMPPRATTDSDGGFVFAERPPGKCSVYCVEWTTVAAPVPADGSDVELRLPADVVLVRGSLWRDGALVREHQVEMLARSGDPPEPNRLWDADGRYRCLLRPGVYTLRVLPMPNMGEDIWLSEHEVVVPAGVASFEWRVTIGGTPCDILVEAAGDRRGSALGIDVNGRASLGGGEGHFAVNGDVGTEQRIWLPPGEWRVHVHGPRLAAMAERAVVVDATSPRKALLFAAEPAVTVRLVLRDPAGKNVAIAPELVAPLRVAGGPTGEVPCGTLDGKANRLGFAHVPLGACELQLADRVVDGVHWFVPFEPQAPVMLHANDGIDNEIALTVQRRAFVDIRGCTGSGREDATACVEVWLGERRVRGRAEPAPQRWAAWLPPGIYRVVIDRNGVRKEHALQVALRDVSLRLRP